MAKNATISRPRRRAPAMVMRAAARSIADAGAAKVEGFRDGLIAAAAAERERRTRARGPTPAAELAKTPQDPVAIGVTGTQNYGGRLFVEPQSELRDDAGHGLTGLTVGEYENLALTDPDVEMMVTAISDVVSAANVSFEGPDERARKLVEWNLRDALEPTLHEVIRQQVSGGLIHGWSLHEVVPAVEPHPDVPGGLVRYVAMLDERLQRSMTRNAWQEVDGVLDRVRQWAPVTTSWQGIDIPADRLLLYTRRRTGNNYQGRSALRPVWYIGKIRARLLTLLGMAHERETMGVPVVIAGKTAYTPERLAEAVDELMDLRAHERSAMGLPPEWDVKWFYGQTANKSSILDSYERLGQIMRTAWLLQFLGLGTTDSGSRAVGEVHLEFFQKSLRAVAEAVAGVFNGVSRRPYTGVIKKIVDWNLGPPKDARYPKLALSIDVGEAKSLLTLLVAKSAQLGSLAGNVEAQNMILRKAGLPTIQELETGPLPGQPQPPRPGKPKAEPEEGSEEEDAGEAEVAKQKGAAMADRPAFAGRRGKQRLAKYQAMVNAKILGRLPRPSEEHLALAEMAATMDEAPDELARAVNRAIQAALDKGTIARYRRIVEDKDTEALKRLPILGGTSIKAAVQDYVDNLREAGGNHVKRERSGQIRGRVLENRAEGETAMAERRKARRIKGRTADEMADAMASDAAAAIEARVQRAATNTASQMILRGGEFGEADFDDAVKAAVSEGMISRDAASITGTAFNLGREEMASAYGDEIAQVVRSEVMDANVCGVCEARDGNVAPFGSDEHDAMVPPDPECESTASGENRCRGILVYEFKD